MIGLENWQRDADVVRAGGDGSLVPPEGTALAEFLIEHLAFERTLPIQSVEWTFARWKPGVSLTCAYEVTLKDREACQVVLKSYARPKDRELRIPDTTANLEPAPFRPHAWIPSRATHIWSYPHDRVLPGVERIHDMRRTRRLVDSSGVYSPLVMRPGPSVVTTLRYKPERRAVFRLDARLRPEGGGPRTAARMAIRVLPPDVAAEVVANRVAANAGPLFPSLLAHEARTGTLLEEWIDGEVPERREFVHEPEAAQLLHALHALPVARGIATPAATALQAEPLFECHPGLASLSAGIEPVSPCELRWTHGDFHPEQMIYSENRWRFMDLDAVGLADPLRDLSSWITDRLTHETKPNFDKHKSNWLEHYGPLDEERLARHVAFELRQRAAGALRRLQADAVEVATRCLELAQDVLPTSGVSVPRSYDKERDRLYEVIPTGAEVERVELDKRERLLWTVSSESESYWYATLGNAVEELRPESEDSIPFVSSHPPPTENIVSWRPGRRMVVRDVAGYRKAWKPRRYADAVSRHEIGRRAGGFETAEILDSDAQSGSVLFSALQGLPLLDAGDLRGRFFEVGRALREFQQGESASLDQHGQDSELEVLGVWRSKLERVGLPIQHGWFRCFEKLSRERLKVETWTLTHRDLHDGQLLVTPSGIGLLDFDLLCQADAALDVGNLLAHLKLRAMQSEQHAKRLESNDARLRFLEGYGKTVSSPHLAWYECAALLRLTLVYALRPRWRELCPSLTRAAESALAEVCP